MILLSIETSTIITSIVIFFAFNFLLVAVILYAKAKLTPSGLVKIDINGQNTIEVEAGSSILTTLSNKKIFLPSACGGGGTCAMCKCQVLAGGGEILTTERPYFTRKQQQENWRLGCQVKVKQDMKIKIPEEVLGIKKWECEVVSNYNVSTFIKEFVVKLPAGESLKFEAGGYIQIDVPEITVDYKTIDITPHPELGHSNPLVFKSDWDKFKLWDLKMKNEEPIFRAYSMANHPAEGNIVMLNIRVATPPWDRANNKWMDVNPGICSSYIFSRKPGDKVTISGPYGEFHINKRNTIIPVISKFYPYKSPVLIVPHQKCFIVHKFIVWKTVFDIIHGNGKTSQWHDKDKKDNYLFHTEAAFSIRLVPIRAPPTEV